MSISIFWEASNKTESPSWISWPCFLDSLTNLKSKLTTAARTKARSDTCVVDAPVSMMRWNYLRTSPQMTVCMRGIIFKMTSFLTWEYLDSPQSWFNIGSDDLFALGSNIGDSLLCRFSCMETLLVVRGDHICPCTYRGQVVTCSGYFLALKKIAPGKCHPKCPFDPFATAARRTVDDLMSLWDDLEIFRGHSTVLEACFVLRVFS